MSTKFKSVALRAFATAAALTLALTGFAPAAHAATGSVAKVGDTEYATFQEALDAAKSGDSVTLIDNVVLDKTAFVEGKSIVLELNGKTVSNEQDIYIDEQDRDEWSLISVRDNASLTVNGDGALKAKSGDCYCIDLTGAGNVTINGGKYVGNISVIYIIEKGNLVINDGDFSIQQLSGKKGYEFLLNCYDPDYASGRATIEVNGGVFHGFNPGANAAESGDKSTNFLGYGAVVNENATTNPSSYSVSQLPRVALVGNARYVSLSDAIGAVKDGGTVTLLSDVTESIVIPEGKELTLDLAGKAIANTDGSHTITNNGTLTIKDSVGGGVVDNTSHARGALVNAGTATIESGKLTRSKEAGSSPTDSGGNSWYVIDNNGGSLTVSGGEVVSAGKFSSLVRNLNGSLKVEGGHLENGFITLKNDDGGKMEVTGGEIVSETQAVQNWSNAAISGGELKGDVNTFAYGAGGSSLTISGGASVSGKVGAINYQDATNPPKVTISGGKIDGEIYKATHDGKTSTPADPSADSSDIVISGGLFADPSVKDFIDSESGLVEDENGNLTVVEAKLVPSKTVVDGVFSYDIKGGTAKALVESDLLALVFVSVDGYAVKVDSKNLDALNKAIAAGESGKTFEFVYTAAKDAVKAADELDPLTVTVKLTDSGAPNKPPVSVMHTVTFIPVVGGDEKIVVEVEDGAFVKLPKTPTYEGYAFAGWFLDKDLKQPFDSKKTAITNDLTLYGGWYKDGAEDLTTPDKPKGELPKTGDDSMLPIVLAGTVGVAAVATGIVLSRKKK